MPLAAIGQICSTSSMEHNLQQCVQLVKEASAAGAKVLFLPEASDYIAESRQQSLALAQPESSSPFVLGLQAAAREHGVDVNVGIHVPAPSTDDDGAQRLLNRTIHIAAGAINARGTYDKLHLFDYGALRESAHTAPGAALTPPFATPVGRVGAQTCFDLRFPEPALALARWGGRGRGGGGDDDDEGSAQVLTYPSAFTVPTGLAHWEVLLRARAIEAQCFVVAAAQVGVHHHHSGGGAGPGGRVSFGRSMAVDPWGRVLCALPGVGADGEVPEGAAPALGVFDVDLGEWERVRDQMPLVRRTDVYPEL
ncbi:hypothetical protein RB599_008015 [Gaeumannomyces hyphopodioides]